MALAAIISVVSLIEDLLESPRISITSFTRELLQFACHQAWLKDTLCLRGCGEVVRGSNEEIIIIEEARSLQDAIEFALITQLLHQSKICKPTFSLNLDHLKPDVDRFTGMAEEMKGHIKELLEQKAKQVNEQHKMEICGLLKNNDEEEDVSAAEMVGLDDEFQRFRKYVDDVTFWKPKPHFNESVFCITGMAGVGKTALAKRFYNDPMVKAKFECWAFVRVGRGYCRERITRSLNAQLNYGDEKMIKEGDSLKNVEKSLRTTLRNKNCLIVLDDFWDIFLFEYIHGLVGRAIRKSMTLVTSRQKLDYSIFNFEIRFMNEDESWELLRKKVFGEGEVCPPLLVESGKKIAKRCVGLPLLINALAPILLQKAEKDPESWKRVAMKPNSLLEEASLQISEVLLSSFHELDETYKIYFLYITAFPESYVVNCSVIHNLLYAEGFHRSILHIHGAGKSFVVHALLRKNLVLTDMDRSKNLVLTDAGRSWTSNKIQAFTIHCAYWYVNKRVARDNMFLYIMNSYDDGMDEHVKSHQRLAIQTNVLFAIKEVFENIASISNVHSILCTGLYNQYQVPICFEWKMLRVLDVVTIRFYEFPVEVVTLVLLRYLALTCNGNLPPSISKLWNLQFLIFRQHLRIKRVGFESFVPVEIWDLQELIHLEIMERNMPEPPHPGVILPNLTHLLGVGMESCTKGVVDNIPKLVKLRVQVELSPGADQYSTCLCDVKSFQCMVMNPTLISHPSPPPPLSVPVLDNVDKLSLGGFGYPWIEMRKIARLPNLRVLKLRSYAFRGEKWEVDEEMSFMKLEYLYIEDTDLVQWIITENGKMQKLWKQKMKNCYKLQEMPSLYGNIVLIDCNPLAEISANLRCRRDNATAIYSWKEKKGKST